jgi:hypothetical protein
VALYSCGNIRHSLCVSKNGWGMHGSNTGIIVRVAEVGCRVVGSVKEG